MKLYSIGFEAKILKNIHIEAENKIDAKTIAGKMIEEKQVCFEQGEQNHDDFNVYIKDVWEKQEDGGFINV